MHRMSSLPRYLDSAEPFELENCMSRILLVEDHEEIWDFLSRRLKRRGHDVILATDGQAGVDRAKEERPDIVLLDMNLPVMDGWTAAGLMKAMPETRGVPIIALTAHAMAGDRRKRLPRAATTIIRNRWISRACWNRSTASWAGPKRPLLDVGLATPLGGWWPA